MNHIGSVIVSMLTSSAEDDGFEVVGSNHIL
jgi:hypothetical protein